MKFYSPNHNCEPTDFQTALFRGLAEDGGLYMPNATPRFIPRNYSNILKNIRIESIAHKVLSRFTDISAKNLRDIVSTAFNFPAPLVKLDNHLYILELFHGPTLSFKDFGARFMAQAIDYYLRRDNEKLNIITATSGDTGSAVAHGFLGLPNVRVFVLYPSRRISQLQEKQIATLGKNIIAIEVRGDFDDCQRLAKTALADQDLRAKINLSSANSINIGRLLPQMVYYFEGFARLAVPNNNVKKPHSNILKNVGISDNNIFVVPSGNFGNLTAGLFAKKMGLPVSKFIAAVNSNSIIPEFLNSGQTVERKTCMTLSSAMDVGRPSNWARIMDLYGGHRAAIKKDIEAIRVSEVETKKIIREIYKKYNYILDPHTAVGVGAALKHKGGASARLKNKYIILATAHPAKFKDIVEGAIGKKVELPSSLEAAARRKKKSRIIGKDYVELHQVLERYSHARQS